MLNWNTQEWSPCIHSLPAHDQPRQNRILSLEADINLYQFEAYTFLFNIRYVFDFFLLERPSFSFDGSFSQFVYTFAFCPSDCRISMHKQLTNAFVPAAE